MLNRIIQDISDFFAKQFRVLGILNYRVFFYCALIYAIIAVHHFLPILYSLYTFENLTLVFCLQLILLIIYKDAYFRKVFHHYLKQVSIYFDITNFFLIIIVFVGIFLFSIRGADISELAGFLIILGIGYIYNSIHKNEKDTLFVQEGITRIRSLFLLTVNGWIYLFLRQFLFRNGLQHLTLLLIPTTLVVFNVIILAVFTDAFERLRQGYEDWIMRLSRKTTKRLRLARTIFASLLTISVLISGGYFGYGHYRDMMGEADTKSVAVNEVSIPNDDTIINERFPLPQEDTLGTGTGGGNIENTGSQNRTGSLLSTNNTSQTGILTTTGTGTQPVRTPLSITGTGSETKIAPKKKVRDLYSFDRYIGIGNTGKDVIQLQTLLKKSGYYKGAITGTFDTVTGDALARFLRAKTGTKNSYTQLGPKALGMLNGVTVE